MGYGSWDSGTYDRVTRTKIDTGTSFAYTDHVRSTMGSSDYKAHDSLNVLKHKNSMLESRDSDEHPNSTPIVIGFDETGSMGDNPSYIQKSLKSLFGMLVRQDYVADPQIAIAAYGDAWCDSVPIQCSQFESDNRIDDCLDNVFIEGRGGGNSGETSAMLAYYIAHHTVTDAWEKRGKKGYVFLIGDECSLSVRGSHIRKFIGDTIQSEQITPEEAFGALKEKWNVYFLLIDNDAAKWQDSRKKYAKLLGSEHVITLKSGKDTAATIASIIGACEQTADVDTLRSDLIKSGFSDHDADAAVSATLSLYKGDGGAALARDGGGRGTTTVTVYDAGDVGDLNL